METKFIKKDSQANPETRHKKNEKKNSVSRLSRTLKIVLSPNRDTIFHKIVVVKKKNLKGAKKCVKNHEKSKKKIK